MPLRRREQRGFVLVAMACIMMLLVAIVGLALDFGRIYIAHNEAQVFTDSAAMTAAAALSKDPGDVDQARQAVRRLPMKWNLGTEKFSGVTVEFSADGSHWEESPKQPFSGTMARVTAPSNRLEITLLRAVGAPETLTIPARSVAAVNPVRLTE